MISCCNADREYLEEITVSIKQKRKNHKVYQKKGVAFFMFYPPHCCNSQTKYPFHQYLRCEVNLQASVALERNHVSHYLEHLCLNLWHHL